MNLKCWLALILEIRDLWYPDDLAFGLIDIRLILIIINDFLLKDGD